MDKTVDISLCYEVAFSKHLEFSLEGYNITFCSGAFMKLWPDTHKQLKQGREFTKVRSTSEPREGATPIHFIYSHTTLYAYYKEPHINTMSYDSIEAAGYLKGFEFDWGKSVLELTIPEGFTGQSEIRYISWED